mmetsp:Transcript_108862/g.347189  ORF Transcript_108862/g.347189 Transcript_108862/m.347189 type:complete len:274 (+) Transcript_108862:1180-2001(+)
MSRRSSRAGGVSAETVNAAASSGEAPPDAAWPPPCAMGARAPGPAPAVAVASSLPARPAPPPPTAAISSQTSLWMRVRRLRIWMVHRPGASASGPGECEGREKCSGADPSILTGRGSLPMERSTLPSTPRKGLRWHSQRFVNFGSAVLNAPQKSSRTLAAALRSPSGRLWTMSSFVRRAASSRVSGVLPRAERRMLCQARTSRSILMSGNLSSLRKKARSRGRLPASAPRWRKRATACSKEARLRTRQRHRCASGAAPGATSSSMAAQSSSPN